MTEGSDVVRTVRDLRRRWKPTKDQLIVEDRAASLRIRIRIHRACSWLQRAENLPEDDWDGRLTFSWIAFNSLYGRWDPTLREPRGDRQSWHETIDLLCVLDQEQYIPAFLESYNTLVSGILDDQYVSKFYWEQPGPERATKVRSARFKARTWYFEKRYAMILERVIERVYFLRCQLLHGGATCGSSLNRESLQRCVEFMQPFLMRSQLIIVDHGIE